jgi:hypothetical protein
LQIDPICVVFVVMRTSRVFWQFELRISAAALLSIPLIGCGSGSYVAGTGPNSSAPAILQQPVSQSVPMGLSATFAVSASGSPLNYQWEKNGTPVSGATGSTYTTPPTAFTDTGSTYSAIISNSLGSVTSNSATLTVTARAPKAGDLRFQQVDAASTVNGYADGPTGIGSAIPGRSGAYFSLSIGTPLYVSPIVCGQPPITAGYGCEWPFEQFYLPSNLMNLGLSTGYSGGAFSDLQTDLQSSSFPAGGSPINSANSVVTSLDLEAPDDLFAVSWIQSSQSSGFDLSQQTVAPADFQAAASAEGAKSRVITAVSYNNGQVVYFSYGWQSDTSTVYETQVASASAETVATVAAKLAAQGYIITALGGSNLNDSYLLVGTRVQGDTMPRPFQASSSNSYATIIQPGYAIVGVVQDAQGNTTYLGER